MLQWLSNNSIKYGLFLLAIVLSLRKICALLTCKRRSIQEKVVLITGASSGLGLALTRVFLSNGCKLIITSRKIEQLRKVKEELLRNNFGDIYEPKLLELDLNCLHTIPEKAKEALDFYGKIDILVNNAGVSFRGLVTNTSLDVHQRIMNTNYFGHVALTKEILDSMLKRKTGDIVVINSVQGKIAIPLRSAYAASKHALTAFFDSLRAELVNEGVNVCVINPGYIQTNLSLNALTENGSIHGLMDDTTASGMDASVVAQRILDSIMTNEKEVTIAPVSVRAAIVLRSILPDIYFKIMNKRAIKARICEIKSQ